MINRNIPKIRFKEFINNWNNYKLGQLGKFKSGIGFPDSQQGGTEGIPFFKVSDMNNIGNETEMRNANNYVTQEQIMKNSWKVIDETPAIIFAKVGAALMLNRKRLVTRPFLIDNNTMSYSFDESWDKDFGLTLFQTINLPKYAQIGALPSYNASDIAMIKVNVPNVQEQSAIGSLFRTLDDLLASYKDNLASYQSLKATILSKMFPKAGQTVPEIRLDGFEGEWENLRLGDCAIIKGRLGWKSLKQEEYTEVGPSMIAGKHIKNGVIDWGEVDHIPQWRYDESPEIMLENGDIIFSKDGSLGNPALVSNLKGEATINSTMMLVRLDKKVSSQFFYQVLTSSVFQKLIYLKVSGSSIPHLFQADMQDFRFFAPCIEEQQAIGSYFSNLDNLINSYQEKISQLETLKKKLLQDMFI